MVYNATRIIYDYNSYNRNENNSKTLFFTFGVLLTFFYFFFLFYVVLEINCQYLCIHMLIKATLEKCYSGCYDIATDAKRLILK